MYEKLKHNEFTILEKFVILLQESDGKVLQYILDILKHIPKSIKIIEY